MTRSRTEFAHPTSGRAASGPTLSFATELYQLEMDDDQRSLRLGVTVAVAVHLLFLFSAIPSLQQAAAKPAEKPKVLQLPPLPKVQRTLDPPVAREPARPIPVPDLTPDDTPYEPSEVTTEIVLPTDDHLYLELPSAPPRPVAVPQVEAPSGPIRVGGRVAPPTRLVYVAPSYTALARRARIEGKVQLEATIDVEGRVVDLKVLKGLPLGLTEEAVDAVSKWRFEPSRLNGHEVAVLYLVTVDFKLH